MTAPLKIEAPQIEITLDEILADLRYPAPAEPVRVPDAPR
jgi:hypothetical protein